jgi:hypothetical protein
MEAVTDLRDTRVLIPPMRRALDGPQADSPQAVSATLSDEQLNAVIADAIASVIFNSGNLFGHELQVVSRDDTYMSPVAWQTDVPLNPMEITVVISQAALDYFYGQLSTQKTAETIADEATNWSWEMSPQVLVERLRQLRIDRDSSLEQMIEMGMIDDTHWVSLIQSRDVWSSRVVEPWLYRWQYLLEAGGGIDMETIGQFPGEVDAAFLHPGSEDGN